MLSKAKQSKDEFKGVKEMKLSFGKKISQEKGVQIYPCVAETGVEIEDVKECSVCSQMGELTTMNFTVSVRTKERNEETKKEKIS